MRTIESIYTSFKCKKCKKELILLTEEVAVTLRAGKYISCSHCGSKDVIKTGATDDLRKIMTARSYKRVHGAIRER